MDEYCSSLDGVASVVKHASRAPRVPRAPRAPRTPRAGRGASSIHKATISEVSDFLEVIGLQLIASN